MRTQNGGQRSVLLLNGPNLNRLGERQPEIYGSETLAVIHTRLAARAATHSIRILTFQSNHEGELVDYLQQHGRSALGVILNPGALAHCGWSLRDCLEDLSLPTVEVHISNVHRREPFRQQLVLSAVVTGQIVGLGTYGYDLALDFLLHHCMS